jgi:D-alanyl-D-alanine carboxypeptidase (penicillin-binding protein 5/6)
MDLSERKGAPRPPLSRARRTRASRRRAARSGGLRPRRGLHHSGRRGRLATVALRLLLAAAVVLILGAALVAVQLHRASPLPVLRATLTTTTAVAGPVPTLPWPRSGEAAVAVTGIGPVGSAGPTTPVPIGSLAKVMAAVVVLRDHPLALGQSGPEVAITAADRSTYEADLAAGESVAPVVAGESLSELQLLEGLLIPSAGNLAPVLARWDDGGEAAFVAKLNSTAEAMGLRATHYADANGVSPATVSTASDQLHLAAVAAANPVLMAIVRQRSLRLPNSPPLSNFDTALGQDGIVGIKTGSTSAAGGCFMFAADATAAGRHVQILGVVLGQHSDPLIPAALNASLALIGPVVAALHPFTVLPAGTVVAQISSPANQDVTVATTRAVTVLHFGPTSVRLALHANTGALPHQLAAGSQVATITVSAAGQVSSVPAITTGAIQSPSLRWRLERR